MDRLTVEDRLTAAGCVDAADEAVILLRTSGGDPAVLEALVRRRERGEPIAWLTGSVTFCGVEVFVEPGVYVPRPHTEALARRAASVLPAGGVAVDLCTGTGAVPAALAAAVPTARVVGTDVDPIAVGCARRNGVETFEGSLDDALPAELEGAVDVLTAVVPYVPTDSIRLLPRDVQAFEPRRALDGGPDGTELLAETTRRSPRWLRPGGWLLMELGGDQSDPIEILLASLGFSDVEVLHDEDGDPRAIVAKLER